MMRFDLINEIVSINSFQTYLEIGVYQPEICFDRINCEKKTGVDPGLEHLENPVDYKVTSDQFFEMLARGETEFPVDHKWDVVFIDGLHLADQVYKDINNSLRHLSDNGFIVLHDCLPPNFFMAREDYDIDGVRYPWNGTTWKAYYRTLVSNDSVEACLLNTDWGLGVIKKSKREVLPENTNQFYEFNRMISNYVENMNVVSYPDLVKFITNPKTKEEI